MIAPGIPPESVFSVRTTSLTPAKYDTATSIWLSVKFPGDVKPMATVIDCPRSDFGPLTGKPSCVLNVSNGPKFEKTVSANDRPPNARHPTIKPQAARNARWFIRSSYLLTFADVSQTKDTFPESQTRAASDKAKRRSKQAGGRKSGTADGGGNGPSPRCITTGGACGESTRPYQAVQGRSGPPKPARERR